MTDTLAAAIANCDREPIHIPGSIQPHGILLVVANGDTRVVQASANAADALGRSLAEVFGDQTGERLQQALNGIGTHPEFLFDLTFGNDSWAAIAHRGGHPEIILELERASPHSPAVPNMYSLFSRYMSALAPAASVSEIGNVAAREIRRITGYDRALIYRFDKDWNGTVVSEDRNQELPSYLDLRFPASDIPAQARELYRLNRLRIIPDAGYRPVPIEPPRTVPLDLSFSVLRSVSPVHLEYMKNMGTGASMSISILRDGELWGLVSCHNKIPRMVPFAVRGACDIMTQMLSARIAAVEHRAEAESRVRLQSTQTHLLAHLAGDDSFTDAMRKHPEELLACAGAAGAALLFEGECHLCGIAPPEAAVRALAAWLRKDAPVFHTDMLAGVYPPAADFADTASGVIAVSISSLHENFIMWFRPELRRTVKWSGAPAKQTDPSGRLSPRESFGLWTEIVRQRSQPWTQSEIDSAGDLRQAVMRLVLRRAEELAQLTGELRRSNEELEAFSYSVSHDLRAPFRHIVGFAELLAEHEAGSLSETSRRYIRTIVESAEFAGRLVDNLLSFSQLGRAALHFAPVDTEILVAEVKRVLLSEERERKRNVEWHIGPLPPVTADLFMLRLVFQNLLANALKYTRPRDPAIIRISAAREPGGTVFCVKDNGVGFDPQYAGKLFGIFQRLHRMEDFEGTGIGLAHVRRMIGRHGGRTWADGETDRGATFWFSIPDSEPDPEEGS